MGMKPNLSLAMPSSRGDRARSATIGVGGELPDVPVAHLADTPMVLIVSSASNMQTVNDFITAARANRGGMNYGSTGVGAISHLVMESLKLAADIDIVHVPYRGAAPALADLHAGQVQAMFTSTASAAPMVSSGKFRPLAVTTRTRSPLLPTRLL